MSQEDDAKVMSSAERKKEFDLEIDCACQPVESES